MAHDYKRNAAYKPKTKIPGWLTFTAGLAVGLFAAFLLYLKQQSAQEQRVSVPPAATAPATTAQTETQDSNTPPRFDFYTILPEQEVILPDPEVKETKPDKSKPETGKPRPPASTAPSATTTSPPPPPPGKKGNYMVQVGAFKKAEEADRLRAALALLGIESAVQVVRIGDSDSFHRVRVGPFDDLERANRTRNKLKQNNYTSILLQVKS